MVTFPSGFSFPPGPQHRTEAIAVGRTLKRSLDFCLNEYLSLKFPPLIRLLSLASELIKREVILGQLNLVSDAFKGRRRFNEVGSRWPGRKSTVLCELYGGHVARNCGL